MSAVSRSTIARAIVLAILIAVPLVQANNYWVHVFTVALIGTILALGLQLLVGMAGLLSLGQAAFYGIGAYTAAILATSYGVPFPISLLCAGIAAAVSSLLLIPIVRLKGSSLAVATLGFGIIVHLVMLNEDGITGGSIGLMGIPKPFLFGFNVGSERAFYYVSLVIAALTFVALDRLRRSRFGRGLIAISQDEEAARASGISLGLYKSKCFLVAAFTAGIAGALYAYHSRYLNPNDFTFGKSIEIIIMVVIGGLGSLPGAALGAAIVVLLPEFLRASGEYRLIIFGVLVVLLMGVKRGGLMGLLVKFGERISLLWRGTGGAARPVARPSEP